MADMNHHAEYDIKQLEALCQALYTAGDSQQRSIAEQSLKLYTERVEYMGKCKDLMDQSSSPYAQYFACHSLLKLVTEHSLSNAVRLDMKKYFLTYVDTRGPAMQDYTLKALMRLLCRTVKLGWFQDDRYRSIVDDGQVLLNKGTNQSSERHYYLGLLLLVSLVGEMNQPVPGSTLTQHRKIAVSFRDLALLRVFQMSLAALRTLKDTNAPLLQEQAMQLSLQCLSFDFVGTCLDESTEELGTIQVPSSWRAPIEDPATLDLFLGYYGSSSLPLSSLTLQCMVRLASVRRSLFSNEVERSKFLNRLINATRQILKTKQGLSEHANYHEFCRLLGRLKTNYQLAELTRVDNYMEWIEMVAQLTVDSLKGWLWASSSVFYLLGLWSRLVTSLPYNRGESPSHLESTAPRIVEAYIESRLDSVKSMLMGDTTEDPLENEEQLQDQLDALPYLCRFQYESSSAYICGIIDPCILQYEEASKASMAAWTETQEMALRLLEGQLAWMVYIISAVIRGRLSANSSEFQEVLDGELSARVLKVLQIMDTGAHVQRCDRMSRQQLDTATLAFFQSFRKVYIGDQVMHASRVYTQLQERLGLQDHLMVLGVILRKVATNLRSYASCERIVRLTLSLFQDLAAGYMSGRLLMQLDIIQHMLANHTSEEFAFLNNAANASNRTVFYHTLARLLFMEDAPSRFRAFVKPLDQVLQQLGSMMPVQLRQSAPASMVAGLFRDLRGIALATNSRRTYGMLFDWLYPVHMPVVLRCLEVWTDTPEVSNAILKFVMELVYNKTQRITFDSSSPNGILLFREVSKVLCTFGSAVLTLGPAPEVYLYKYKGIWLCLVILARALGGNYCNLGVFDLYDDPALKNALEVAIKMCLAMPLHDILVYRKVAKAYYALLEVLCHNHTATVANADNDTFTFLITSLDHGVKSHDIGVSTQCASAIDNVAGYYFKYFTAAEESISAPPPAAQALRNHLTQKPDLLPNILKTLFEIVLCEDCTNQWSLSRPMLTLILINEPHYNRIRQEIINAQPPDKQQHLSNCLDNLMRDVNRNLEPRNRDKFTQNLTIARHEFRSAARA